MSKFRGLLSAFKCQHRCTTWLVFKVGEVSARWGMLAKGRHRGTCVSSQLLLTGRNQVQHHHILHVSDTWAASIAAACHCILNTATTRTASLTPLTPPPLHAVSTVLQCNICSTGYIGRSGVLQVTVAADPALLCMLG